MLTAPKRQNWVQSIRAGDTRIPIAALALAGLAIVFWVGSRYPSLNDKAIMGGNAPLSGFAFDILFDIFPDSSLWWQFVANNVNWVMTNIKGMTFGVLFGAAVLTLLSLIEQRSFKNGFANSALGTIIGAPLGVCVNCAAPIALGLHMGRMRLETTLSALLASPTLNVIVVTMSFSLLPLHIALTKLVLALFMVLFVVPVLCRLFLKEEVARTQQDLASIAPLAEGKGLTAWIARSLSTSHAQPRPDGIGPSLLWFVRTFSRNLFFIAIITVPMMFLAALMATVIAMGFDSGALATALPYANPLSVLLAMVAVALIASLVPAPIALDVILTIVLLGLGLGSHYGAVLIIALGTFSFYAFLVLWKAVSLKTAVIVWGATIVLAVAGGVIAYVAAPYERIFQANRMASFIESRGPVEFPEPPEISKGSALSALKDRIAAQSRSTRPVGGEILDEGGNTISVDLLVSPAAEADDDRATRFSRVAGPDIGLMDIAINTPLHELAPQMMMGGIGSGDVHKDGWPDVVFRRPLGAKGLSLYANLGGRFERQALELGPVDDLQVANTALVDLDNDEWLDLVVTTAWDGVFVFANQEGTFSSQEMLHISGSRHSTVLSIAFSDLNNDGNLDMILGNWNSRQGGEGWAYLTPLTSRNQVAWNKGNGTFVLETMPGSAGQTLTGLVTDYNRDGRPEYLKGDDLAATDEFIFFDADGRMATSREQQPFPYFTQTSMSYDEGDWNNDLLPDYYGGQISEARTSSVRSSRRGDGRVNQLCEQYAADMDWTEDAVRRCAAEIQSINMIRSRRTGFTLYPCQNYFLSDRDATLCGITSSLSTAANLDYFLGDISGAEARSRCENALQDWPEMAAYCKTYDVPTAKKLTQKEIARRHAPALSQGNILLTGDHGGTFTDAAPDQAVNYPGWTWNSRFVDLDQDGWQDIFVGIGSWFAPTRSSTNMLYHNRRGAFVEDTASFGLDDIVPTYSFVSLDFDGDGDIDIIRPPEGHTAIVHRNEKPAGPALWVHLRDEIGNRMGVDARVTICVDGQTTIRPGKCQTRPVNASGGYMSFDPIAAHFGLGSARSVSLITVIWRDGTRTTVMPDDMLGGEVIIRRTGG